jgi:ribosomal protein L37AE/L43A
MVTTNYTKKRSWKRGYPSKSNKVVIADNSDSDIKEYICSSCNRTRHTRQSKGELECLYCGETINIEGTRKRSKLETPHQNTETLVSTTPGPNYKDVTIKREPELQGSFKMLKDRGLRVFDYREGTGQ